jgi:hypothetical protein
MPIFWTFAGIGLLVFLSLCGVALIIFAARRRER